MQEEMYIMRRRLGGIYVEEIIVADSFEGAQAQADRRGGEITGTLFDESPIMHDRSDADYE